MVIGWYRRRALRMYENRQTVPVANPVTTDDDRPVLPSLKPWLETGGMAKNIRVCRPGWKGCNKGKIP
jgi:hypothetical protein